MPSLDILINMAGKPFVFPVLIALAVWALLAAPTFARLRRSPGIHGSAAAIALSVALLIGITTSRSIGEVWPSAWIDWLPTLLGLAFAGIAWIAMLFPWLPRKWRTLAIGDLAAIGTLIAVWPIALRYGNAQGWSLFAIASFIIIAALIAAALALTLAVIHPLPHPSSLAPASSGKEPGRGSSDIAPSPLPTHAILIPLGLPAAILGMAAAGVFTWGAPSTATNIATLGVLVGVFALLTLPPLRFTGAANLRWLAPIIATTVVALAAAALVSSADPIPWPSPLLLAAASLTPLLLRLPKLNPSRGWPAALLGLTATLGAAALLTLGSVAFTQGWISTPTTQDTAEQDNLSEEEEAEAEEYRQMFENWTPDD